MKIHSIGTVERAIYTPTKWRNVKDAPTDGQPIIMRNPAWTHDLVVAWEPLTDQQSANDPTHGWVWKKIAIEKNGIPADFSDKNFEEVNSSTTKWAVFGPTPKAMKASEHFDAFQATQDPAN